MPLLPQGLDMIHVKLVLWFSKNTNPSSPKMRYQIYIQLPKYHILSSQNIRHNKLQMLFKEYLHCLLFRWNQYRLGEGGGHLHNFNWLLRCPSPDPLCSYCTANCTEVLLHSYCTAIALMCYCTVLKCYCTPIAVYCTTIHHYCTTFSLLLYCYCTLPLRCNVVLSHSHCTATVLLLHCPCTGNAVYKHCGWERQSSSSITSGCLLGLLHHSCDDDQLIIWCWWWWQCVCVSVWVFVCVCVRACVCVFRCVCVLG